MCIGQMNKKAGMAVSLGTLVEVAEGFYLSPSTGLTSSTEHGFKSRHVILSPIAVQSD